VDDLEGVGNNAGSQELLSVVAAVHHDRVGQTLDDGALSLAETLGGIAASGVGDVDRGADLDVVAVKIWSASLVAVNWPVNFCEKKTFVATICPFSREVVSFMQQQQAWLRVQQISTYVGFFFSTRANTVSHNPTLASKTGRTQSIPRAKTGLRYN
jgi:hypothetical protein